MASASAQSCPRCGGTGWHRLPADKTGAARVERCGCQDANRTAELLAAAGIPPRYRHCRIENFLVPEGSRELFVAHGRARAYGINYPVMRREWKEGREPSGLLFLGSVGAGKTHLAVAIAQQLIECGIACRFCDHRELLKKIQATFDPANPATEAGVVAPLLETEVLILDDLGVGRATEWAIETLHYILNHRYSHKLATILTTNLEDGEARTARLADGSEYTSRTTLTQAIGERLRSRLDEMCVFVPMHGGDHRRIPPA